MFSDSQLHRLVEKDRLAPKTDWYMNLTPGGTFLDIAVKLEAAETANAWLLDCIVLAVGTNNAGQHMVMERAARHLRQ